MATPSMRFSNAVPCAESSPKREGSSPLKKVAVSVRPADLRVRNSCGVILLLKARSKVLMGADTLMV